MLIRRDQVIGHVVIDNPGIIAAAVELWDKEKTPLLVHYSHLGYYYAPTHTPRPLPSCT